MTLKERSTANSDEQGKASSTDPKSAFSDSKTNEDRQIQRLNQFITERDAKILVLEREIELHKHQLNLIHGSRSLRLTKPFRTAFNLLRRGKRIAGSVTSAVKHSGGYKNTLAKIVQRYQIEGVAGLVRALSSIESAHAHPPFEHRNALLLGTTTKPAEALLRPRVLIIAELSIPQCTKYRVKQKQEMFEKLGVDCTISSWTDSNFCFDALSTHTLAIFYRVPGIPQVLDIIAEAKRLNIGTIWEVDDLIFDRALLAESHALTLLDKATVINLLDGSDLYRTAMLACSAGIASTTGLALAMQTAGVSDVFVIENGLDEQTLNKAAEITSQNSEPSDKRIRIVYGSGTNTHNVDFREASGAIAHILGQFPNVLFRLIGRLDIPDTLLKYSKQIEIIPFCTYEEYLSYLASSDISIAPLENYIFNEAKSNIKFLEAAILSIPSVCSPRAAFREAINHGVNGFLCETESQWIDSLTLLVTNSDIRKEIGTAAHASVIASYSSDNIANRQLLPLLKNYTSPYLNRKFRVLSVNVLYSPRSFGGATIVAEAVNRIMNTFDDVEVYVFTTLPLTSTPEYTLRRYEVDGVPVFGMGLPDSIDSKILFENSLVLKPFEEVLNAVQPDLVHFHSIQGIGILTAELCTTKNIPFVVTLHDAWWLCGRQFMVDKYGKYCGQKIVDTSICALCVDNSNLNYYRQERLQSVLKNAYRLLAPSKYFADFYIQNGLPKDKIVVNKNGILKPAERTKRRREKLVFGYVGGNTEIKGIGLVKKAFSILDKADIKLLVVDSTLNLGYSSFPNRYFDELNNVDIVPAYTQKNIDEFFYSIDVLLFPTKAKESFGLIVREALARNVWVITTDAGGVTEDIIPGKNGLIIPLDATGEDLAEAILRTREHFLQFEPGSFYQLHPPKITWFEDQAVELAGIYRLANGELCEENSTLNERTVAN